jgi:uncharacterized repeat protein (TIGR01451 family)
LEKVKKYMNRFHKISSLLGGILFIFGVVYVAYAATAVDMGTADDFAVLGGSTITNTGLSVINGDLGLSPGTSVTGFPPGVVNGTQHVANATAVAAKTDLVTAYNNAAGQTPVSTVPTELGGTTKLPGIYNSAAGTFGITGTLTLDAAGDPDAVFIFQTGSTLTTAGSSVISLINGAQACNVFWQVGSSATLGTNSVFKGNIFALTSITLTTGANVEGRVLARNGAVTLDTNVITRAECVTPPPPPVVPPATIPPAVPPLINIEKVPTPLVLPDGPGSVTYDYRVTNPGTVPMSNIRVSDNTCSPVTFVSGDTNGNSQLDVTETWVYRCTTNVSQTTTNTATATGQANGFTVSDTANATVVVGSDVPAPLINLVKTPSTFILPAGGGEVTYTYTVTNPGTVALGDVSVVDDTCSPISGPTGDTNNNNLLEPTETWVYTCQTTVTTTTTNTGIAEGGANDLRAIDFSVVIVVVTPDVPSTPAQPVTTPSLPNAGIGPEAPSHFRNMVIFVGALVVSGAFVGIAKNRFFSHL